MGKEVIELKKTVFLMTAILVLLAVLCAAAENSGTVGDQLTWQLDSSGVLTISGDGEIPDYDWGCAPWYEDREQVLSLVIEEGVTRIGMSAFVECPQLSSVSLPESLTAIGESAFNNCESLTSFHVPANVTDMGLPFLFDACSRMTEITVAPGNSVYMSENGMLLDKAGTTLLLCPRGATEAVIPSSVTKIGYYALGRCHDLASVTVPEGVKTIDVGAFQECNALTQVNLPSTVETIDASAFAYCQLLTDVHIASSNPFLASLDGVVYSSDMTAVVLCPPAKDHLTLPDTVTTIRQNAFEGCQALTELLLPDSVTTLSSNAFLDCTSLTSISIPEGVLDLPLQTFWGCQSLASVSLPGTLMSIGEGAFQDCPLTDIYFDGTEDLWAEVAIGDSNDALSGAQMHYSGRVWEKPEGPVITLLDETNSVWDQDVCYQNASYGIQLQASTETADEFLYAITFHNDDDTFAPKPVKVTSSNQAAVLKQFYVLWIRSQYTTVAIRAQTRSGSTWSKPTEKTFSIVPKIPLDLPTIETDGFTGTALIGEDLHFTVSSDTRAKYYEWSIRDASAEDIYYGYGDLRAQASFSLTVPETVFDTAGTYTLSVTVSGPGYTESSSTSSSFEITGSRPDAPHISWSAVSGPVGKTVYLTVDTASASHVMLVSDTPYDMPDQLVYIAEGSSMRFPIEVSAASTTWYVRAKYDGVWSVSSENTTLTVTGERPRKPDDWAPIVPETIVPGQDVVVHLDPVEHALSYNVGLWTGEGISILYYEDRTQPGDFVIPAVYFADGGDFDIGIGVGDGYSSDWCWKDVFYSGVAPYISGRTLTAVPSQAVYHDPREITFTLSAAQPEKVIIQEFEAWSNGEGAWTDIAILDAPGASIAFDGVIYDGNAAYYSGEHKYRFAALENGQWTDWSTPVSVTVDNTVKAPLDAPDFTFSASSIFSDEPVTISWSPVQNATSYEIYGLPGPNITTKGTQYTLSAGTLAPGAYAIRVQAKAVGYASSALGAARQLTVRLPAAEQTVLTLPASLKAIEEQAFEASGANRIIVPSGCESIGSQAFARCPELTDLEVPASVTSIAGDILEGCGPVTVHAPSGSAAEAFALSHGLPFEALN